MFINRFHSRFQLVFLVGSPSIESNCSARTTGLLRRRGAVVDTRSRRVQRDTPIEARNAEDGETGIEHRTVAQPGKHASSRYRQTGLITRLLATELDTRM